MTRTRLCSMVLVVVVLGACTDDDSSTGPATTTGKPASAAPASSTTTRAPSPLPVEGSALDPEGRYFGYIRTMDASLTPAMLAFDVAEFLTGPEADRAAQEDKAIAPGQSTPGGFYIRNRQPALRTLQLSDHVVVTRVQCSDSCESQLRGDLEGLMASFTKPSNTFSLSDPYRGALAAYWITLSGGRVTAIDEQYVP